MNSVQVQIQKCVKNETFCVWWMPVKKDVCPTGRARFVQDEPIPEVLVEEPDGKDPVSKQSGTKIRHLLTLTFSKYAVIFSFF